MALKTLKNLISEAQELTTPEAQAEWIRRLSRVTRASQAHTDMTNFVPGCEHPTWLSYELNDQGVVFAITSKHPDSQGVAGIVTLALDGLTVQEIRLLNFSEFRDIARYLNNRQQRTLNALLNRIKDLIGDTP